MKTHYFTKIDQVPQLDESEKTMLDAVSDEFAFRANDYYLGLIDWDDPDDPIRRIVIPSMDELEGWGELDPSGEAKYTCLPGLEHKYVNTALLLVTDVCGAFCRFCFRKRLFMNGNDEIARDVTAGLEYIQEHQEITNVLVTGGDPLIMSTKKLESIIRRLRKIDHVQIIRIGSKMPAFNPRRILDDPALRRMIERYSTPKKRIYVMAHFNHPRELTPLAMEGLSALLKAGAIVVNQTPLIAGINDEPETLALLFKKLSYLGVPPYYVFICRPTLGNATYQVSVENAWEIFAKAQELCSGLAKRARLVMSHATGKIEVVGMGEQFLYLRYHQAADPADSGRFMVVRRDPAAVWFDDYYEQVNVFDDEDTLWMSEGASWQHG
jgi:lysine 2,3-aminomutase